MEDKEDWIVKEIEWDVEDPEGTINNLQAFVDDPSNKGYKFDSMESVSNPSRFRVYMTLERGANKVDVEWKTTYGITGKGHADE
jgi:hypothetical protein